MSYLRALADREQAFARCLQARQQVRAAAADVKRTYRAYPFPVLAGAAIAGIALAQFRVGQTFVMAGMQTMGGPAAGLLKKFLSGL